MKFQKTPAGYKSVCGGYFIEKTEYTEKDILWRVSCYTDSSSELLPTKKECVRFAVMHKEGGISFSN